MVMEITSSYSDQHTQYRNLLLTPTQGQITRVTEATIADTQLNTKQRHSYSMEEINGSTKYGRSIQYERLIETLCSTNYGKSSMKEQQLMQRFMIRCMECISNRSFLEVQAEEVVPVATAIPGYPLDLFCQHAKLYRHTKILALLFRTYERQYMYLQFLPVLLQKVLGHSI